MWGCNVSVVEYDYPVDQEVPMVKKRVIKKQTEAVTAETSDAIPSKVGQGLGRAVLRKINPFPQVEDKCNKSIGTDKN